MYPMQPGQRGDAGRRAEKNLTTDIDALLAPSP